MKLSLALLVSALAQVPTVKLSNGVEMPLAACGSGGDSDAQAKSGVTAALQQGFTSIDTAHDYGCISGVGEALSDWGADKRKGIFLTTKVPGCGVPTQGLQPPCYANTLDVATSDIAKLQTPYVDLLLLHFPPIEGCGGASCTKMQEQWTALEQLYAANKTRAIGVSNYCKECVQCILKNATIKPMVNQMQYHIGMGPDPTGLIEYCHSEGIQVEAYSPLGGGKLLGNFSEGDALAKKYGFNSSAQVALAWLSQRDIPIPFVTKSANAEYLAEDLNLFQPAQHMAAADIASLDNIGDPKCAIEAPGSCCHSP
jgi:diketogulonate reductase-like aldo/keto reductase